MIEASTEELSSDECLALLANGGLGQLTMTRRALPTALPARYVVHGDKVLVHVSRPLEPVPWSDGEVVALHAYAFDENEHTGWTVSVAGRAHGTPALTAPSDAPYAPWVAQGGGDLIELVAEVVHGERLEARRPQTDQAAEPANDARSDVRRSHNRAGSGSMAWRSCGTRCRELVP